MNEAAKENSIENLHSNSKCDDGALQQVLGSIMFSSKSGAQKSSSNLNKNRALTVGAQQVQNSMKHPSSSQRGGLIHIPRFQKEIIMKELMKGKGGKDDPKR